MEESEQPSVERPSNARTTQACQRCRNLKTRCLPSEVQGTCQRCLSTKRDCTWAEIPRRLKRTRGPSRISQVEKKIDGLVANLVASEPRLQPSQPSSVACRSPNSASEPQSLRPHAPGSWPSVPLTFGTQNSSQSETQRETENEQGYLEKLREIHDFGGDAGAPSTAHSISKDKERPIDDDLIQELTAGGEADSLLKEYRAMSDSFPFVPLPSHQTAVGLSAAKPMLFLAILTVASWRDHKLQRKLDERYRIELANRTIIRPRRTLSLFQSLIVYLGWYHFVFSHKTEQTYSLVQLAIGIALDLAVHQETKRTPLSIPGFPKPPPLSPHLQRERQRAYLGCYHLSSACSVALMKPNLLRYSDYIGNCARRLYSESEYPSDKLIAGLISLRRIDDQIQDTFHTESALSTSITDSRTAMNLRLIQSQLEEWNRENSIEDINKTLELSYAFTEMQLHSVFLRPAPPENQAFGQSTLYLNGLLGTLEAGKRFLDALLSFSGSDYHVLCFTEWMRLPHVVVTMLRLCTPSDTYTAIQWDTKAAQDRVRLELYLESLCYRMQGLSTWDKVKQPHTDFWRAMNMILDMTRAWYCRKIKGDGKRSSSQASTNNFPTPEAVGSYGRSGTCSMEHSTSRSADNLGYMQDMGATAMNTSGVDMCSSSQNPLQMMMGPDFDMEQFFDMGIWGNETYEDLGFGGGHSNF